MPVPNGEAVVAESLHRRTGRTWSLEPSDWRTATRVRKRGGCRQQDHVSTLHDSRLRLEQLQMPGGPHRTDAAAAR